MRCYVVEHYIRYFVGNTYSVVYFIHQAVYNAYVGRSEEVLWKFDVMPKLWEEVCVGI